jgi:hypothetical protein
MQLGRLDLARGDRGCCEVPTVARCAVESARGVEVDLEAHLRPAIGRNRKAIRRHQTPYQTSSDAISDVIRRHIRRHQTPSEGGSRLTLCNEGGQLACNEGGQLACNEGGQLACTEGGQLACNEGGQLACTEGGSRLTLCSRILS